MWRSIYPAVYTILRNREEAEDVLQESIVHGFSKLKELREAKSYPAWQKQIALRLALNRIARRKEPLIFLTQEDAEENNDSEMDLMKMDVEMLNRKVENLPEGYRLVVRLHLTEGMTHEEIGSSLGVAASTSRSQYSRAIARLKKEILVEYAKQV